MKSVLQKDDTKTNDEEYDWAKAIYELVTNQSECIPDMLASAGLDPQAGDLSDIDLSNLDLSGQDLSGWDLSCANFEDTILTKTNLKDAKINPISLLKSKSWQKADLDNDVRNKALLLNQTISTLQKKLVMYSLSRRVVNVLVNENVFFIGDLVTMSEVELLRVPNFGRKGLNEVKEVLAHIGLHLGIDLPEWPSFRPKVRWQEMDPVLLYNLELTESQIGDRLDVKVTRAPHVVIMKGD